MNEADELIPTRQSLLSRLKDWNDHESWRVFFDTYWRLVYDAAMKAGLTDAEAQDAVQETLISVMRSMPDFHYRQQRGSFKRWLLCLTNWRIADQLRNRIPVKEPREGDPSTSTGTSTVERIPDPAHTDWESTWDTDWERNLMRAAIQRVKRKVEPKTYQMFDLCVFKQWPVSKVARDLKVNPARVYLAKHRISRQVEKEVIRLQSKIV